MIIRELGYYIIDKKNMLFKVDFLLMKQLLRKINFRALDYAKISLAMYLSMYVYSCMCTLLLYEMAPKHSFP